MTEPLVPSLEGCGSMSTREENGQFLLIPKKKRGKTGTTRGKEAWWLAD